MAVSQSENSSTIAGRLQIVLDHIEAGRKQAPLPLKNKTQLIAVSKTHSADSIVEAIQVGQKHFGENRVQEAEEKWLALKEKFPDITLHMIGALQSNKVRQAVRLFDVFHSLDRPKLVRTMARICREENRRPELLIQVNTGNESQKGGVLPKDLSALLDICKEEKLAISGLMCIPPADEEPAMHFALLKKLAQKNGLEKLSMGMSADYELAASMGADYVRVGTAIFGSRSYPA